MTTLVVASLLGSATPRPSFASVKGVGLGRIVAAQCVDLHAAMGHLVYSQMCVNVIQDTPEQGVKKHFVTLPVLTEDFALLHSSVAAPTEQEETIVKNLYVIENARMGDRVLDLTNVLASTGSVASTAGIEPVTFAVKMEASAHPQTPANVLKDSMVPDAIKQFATVMWL